MLIISSFFSSHLLFDLVTQENFFGALLSILHVLPLRLLCLLFRETLAEHIFLVLIFYIQLDTPYLQSSSSCHYLRHSSHHERQTPDLPPIDTPVSQLSLRIPSRRKQPIGTITSIPTEAIRTRSQNHSALSTPALNHPPTNPYQSPKFKFHTTGEEQPQRTHTHIPNQHIPIAFTKRKTNQHTHPLPKNNTKRKETRNLTLRTASQTPFHQLRLIPFPLVPPTNTNPRTTEKRKKRRRKESNLTTKTTIIRSEIIFSYLIAHSQQVFISFPTRYFHIPRATVRHIPTP